MTRRKDSPQKAALRKMITETMIPITAEMDILKNHAYQLW